MQLDRHRSAAARTGRVLLLADAVFAGPGRDRGSTRLTEALREHARSTGFLALEVDAVTDLVPALQAVPRIPMNGRWRWDVVVVAVDASRYVAAPRRVLQRLSEAVGLLQAICPVVLLLSDGTLDPGGRDGDDVDALLHRLALPDGRTRTVRCRSRRGRLLDVEDAAARLLHELTATPMPGSAHRLDARGRDQVEDRTVLDVLLGGAGRAGTRLRQAITLAASSFSAPCAQLQVIGVEGIRTVARIGDPSVEPRTFAGHLRRQQTALIVPDTRANGRWRSAPECTGPDPVRFYAGLATTGSRPLLLHLWDDRPHPAGPGDAERLLDLATLVAGELDALLGSTGVQERARAASASS